MKYQPIIPEIEINERHSRVCLIVILLIYVAFNLSFLTTFPPVDNVGDESWMYSISQSILETGRPLARIHTGTPLAESPQVTTLWGYSLFLAATMKLLGPSVVAGRVLSLLMGLLTLILTYAFAKFLAGRSIALLTVLMLSVSVVFSWHSREIRPDIMLMFTVLLSLYLYVRAAEERIRLYYFLGGLVVTLSVEVHPHGALFAASMVVYHIVSNRKALLARESLYLACGLFTGTAVWVAFNFIPYSMKAFQSVHASYFPPLLSMDFISLIKFAFKTLLKDFSPEWLGFIKTRYHSHLSITAAYFGLLSVAVGLALHRARSPLKPVVFFVAFPLLIKSFLTPTWTYMHYSVFLPLVFMAFVFSIAHIIRRVVPLRAPGLFLAVVALFVIVNFTDTAAATLKLRQYDFDAFSLSISPHIPVNAHVLGSGIYYLALKGKPVRFSTYQFLQNSCGDFGAFIREHNVGYVILDDTMKNMIRIMCGKEYYNDSVMAFLLKEGTLQEELTLPYPSQYGYKRMIGSVFIVKMK